MLYNYSVKDYESFKNIFGSRKVNGRIINKILISFWKHRYKVDRDFRATQINSVNDLYNLVISQLQYSNINYPFHIETIKLNNYTFIYKTKKFKAPKIYLKDYRLIEYKNSENKICCMKAGKFFREVLKESKVNLDESTITFCSEVFQKDWESYSKDFTELELHIDDDFKRIYSGCSLLGNFGSCMVNKDHYSFYKNAVKAKAAYLTNKNGFVVARCIIFEEVIHASSGNVYRYAERQYSYDPILKQVLIDRLIAANAIDIYKTVGAGCASITSICNKDGTSFIDPRFYIECKLQSGDTISYMDTFRFFDGHKAYNYMSELKIKANLATTSLTIDFN